MREERLASLELLVNKVTQADREKEGLLDRKEIRENKGNQDSRDHLDHVVLTENGDHRVSLVFSE